MWAPDMCGPNLQSSLLIYKIQVFRILLYRNTYRVCFLHVVWFQFLRLFKVVGLHLTSVYTVLFQFFFFAWPLFIKIILLHTFTTILDTDFYGPFLSLKGATWNCWNSFAVHCFEERIAFYWLNHRFKTSAQNLQIIKWFMRRLAFTDKCINDSSLARFWWKAQLVKDFGISPLLEEHRVTKVQRADSDFSCVYFLMAAVLSLKMPWYPEDEG